MAESNTARKTKIFISYSRKDKAFVRKLNDAIDAAGIDAWVDWEGIPLSSDWMSEIQGAIESGDAFVFVISPDSLKSQICQNELELGIKNNKKIIPVLYRDPEKRQKMHPKLASTNWVYLRSRKDDFRATIPKLVDAIQTDLGWVQQHTRLLERGTEWERKNKSKSYLLQGEDLENGEKWMTESTEQTGREVVPVQAEYISSSRKNAVQRQRNLTIGIGLVMILSIFLGIFALLQWNSAEENANLARRSAEAAAASEKVALTQQAIAEEKQELALKNENEAKAQRSAAQAGAYRERPGQLNTSTLLALESLSRQPSTEAEDVLRHNLSIMPIPAAQVKHNGRIWNLHISEDGQYIVSSSADHTACVWTWQGERVLCVQHESDVTDAMLTNDNSLLVTASLDGSVRLWDFKNGSPLEAFNYEANVLDIDLSPNGSLLAAGRKDGFVSIVNIDIRQNVYNYNFSKGPVSIVQFHPGGEWLGVGTKTGGVRIWKAMTSLVEAGPIHEAEIFNLAFSPDGKLLASASEDSSARIARAETGRETLAIQHPDWVEDVAFSPDSSWFVTVSDDKIVRVLDSESGREKLRMSHGSFVQRVEVSPNGEWILSTGYDLTARLWDSQTGALMFEASIDGVGSALTFSQDGSQIIIGDRNGNITIWDVSLLKARVGYIGFTEFVNKAKFDPAGQWMLINTDDKNLWQIPTDQLTTIHDGTLGTNVLTFDELTAQLKVSPDSKWIAISVNSEVSNSRAVLYNLETKVLHSLPHSSDISGLAISPEGKFLATTNEGNTSVFIWEIESGQQINELQFTDVAFTSAYSPKDPILAIGFANKTVLWDTTSNTEIATLDQVGDIRSLTFNLEGNWLATTSSDGSIFVWDMNKKDYSQPAYQFLQDGRITSLDFNSKMGWLASAGADGYVYLWDLNTGEEIVRIPHGDFVSGINFSPDGRLLSSVSRKSLQIWDVNLLVPISKDQLAEAACSRLVRNLTPSQWSFFFQEEEYRPLCPNLPQQ
ncbi:MAG: TIR domain-containing protein [Chloroflexi bacterium]|nr:TIR domain-containing protein [Chloroflexota bacterium]